MFTKTDHYTISSSEECRCKTVPFADSITFSPTDEGLEGGTAEQLSTGLARASPELTKCVASCKHIAETTRQQNNFQNVSFVLLLPVHHTAMSSLVYINVNL